MKRKKETTKQREEKKKKLLESMMLDENEKNQLEEWTIRNVEKFYLIQIKMIGMKTQF